MALKEIYEQKSNEELLERYKDYNNYRDDVKSIILEELKKRGLISDEEIEKKLKEIKRIDNSKLQKSNHIEKVINDNKENEVPDLKKKIKLSSNHIIRNKWVIYFIASLFLLKNITWTNSLFGITLELFLIALIIWNIPYFVPKNETPKKNKFYIIIALLLVAARGGKSHLEQKRLHDELKSYIPVNAYIIKISEIRGYGKNAECILELEFEYKINDEKYTKKGVITESGSDRFRRFHKGDKFKISVNPKDKEKFIFDREQFLKNK